MTAPLRLPSDRDASGRDLGDAEIENLVTVIRSGKLNATGGQFTTRLEREFAARSGLRHVLACASGTAAIHIALAGLRLQAADEVVTSPITDIGAILPILYEGAVPRFCDVEPASGLANAATIERALGPRTRAVIVTHLFGMPCDVERIAALCRARGIALIEDCAQAFLAERGGRLAGTTGDAACWSLQQGKAMTAGEGGLVALRDDAAARHARLFLNKGWDYGAEAPDHLVAGLNLRWTELQAAVACAQFGKLEAATARRRAMAARLDRALAGVAGIAAPKEPTGARGAYWRYALRVDPAVIRGGASALGAALREDGIPAQPHYVQKPAFGCRVFTHWRDEPRLREAYERAGSAPPAAADRAQFPGVFDFLERVVVLPWNERFAEPHVDALAQAIAGAAARLS